MALSSGPSVSRGTSPRSSAAVTNTVYARVVEEMVAEEASLRRRLASRRELSADPISPFDLLRFTRSCLEAASTLLRGPTEPELEAIDAAHRIVCRVETLLRCKLDSRRCYSSSDWLNLCRDFVRSEHSEEAVVEVEHERLAQLQRALEEESRLCAARGAPSDALSAFQEAIACTATRPTESSDLYGLLENGADMYAPERMIEWLALRDRAASASHEGEEDQRDAAFTLHLATEAAAVVQTELDAVCGACSCYFAHAPLTERQRLFGLRAHFGRLLVSVLLYQCNASAVLLSHHLATRRRRQSPHPQRDQPQKSGRSRSTHSHLSALATTTTTIGTASTSPSSIATEPLLPLLEWAAHRITLRYSQVEDLAKRELLDDEEPLLLDVVSAMERWSTWLTARLRTLCESAEADEGLPARTGEWDEERYMPFAERWKFQVQRSRQYAASHPMLLDDSHPALEYLVQRCPGSIALPLLLLMSRSTRIRVAAPPAEALIHQELEPSPCVVPSNGTEDPALRGGEIPDVAVIWHSSESASTRSASTTAGAIVPLPAVSSPKPMEPPLPIAGLRSRGAALPQRESVLDDAHTATTYYHDGRSSSALAAFKKRAFDALGKFVLHPLPPSLHTTGRDDAHAFRGNDSPVPEQHLHSPTPVPPPPSVKPLAHTTAVSSSASIGGAAAFTDSSSSPGARDPRAALSTSRSATGNSSERNFFPLLDPAVAPVSNFATSRWAIGLTSAYVLSEPARAMDAQDVPKPAALVPRPARTLLSDHVRSQAVVADAPPLLLPRHR